jgi:hypothetical protein
MSYRDSALAGFAISALAGKARLSSGDVGTWFG